MGHTKKIALFRVSLTRALFLAASCTIAIGCMAHQPQPLPAWLIHVPPTQVSPDLDPAAYQKKLLSDLNSDNLRSGYISPENIASMAISEIREGRPLDGALLLSISSYTYTRAAMRILEVADQTQKQRLWNARGSTLNEYWKFVKEETKTFVGLNYQDEIQASLGVWEKKRGVHDQLQKGFEELARLEGDRQEAAASQVFSEIERARTPTIGQFKLQALASAYLKRLKIDLEREDFPNIAASYYLTTVPTREFITAALENPESYFSPNLARETSARMSAFRDDVVAALSSANPQTRSNAAICLALNGDEGDIPLIEEAESREQDKTTKLVFLFSVLRLGSKRDPTPLLTAAETFGKDKSEYSDLAIQLIQWSPPEVREPFDTDRFAEILANPRRSIHSRHFAATILSEEGTRRELSAKAIATILKQSMHSDEDISGWSTEAVIQAKQLDRKALIARIKARSPGRPALLLSLSLKATPKDLAFFKSGLFDYEKDTPMVRMARINAFSRIPGKVAEEELFAIFEREPEAALQAAVALANRKDVDKTRLITSARAKGGAPGAAVLISLEEKGGIQMLAKGMQDRRYMQRYQAVELAGVANKKKLRPGLWRQASYSDRRYYPGDSLIRHSAMKGLLRMGLIRAFKAANIKDYHGIETKKR